MHVVVNVAVSADGKLSTRERRQVRISGDEDFARVDRLRAENDAVVVGVGTVLADDPSLLRHDVDHRHETRGADADPPVRVVADSRARTPPDAAILDGAAPTYLLHAAVAPTDRLATLEEAGARPIEAGEERVDLPLAFEGLEGRGVDSAMVEGGGELLFSLFEAGLVDELSTFVGPLVVGGREAPTLADGEGFLEGFPELELVGVERLDGGVVLSWRVE